VIRVEKTSKKVDVGYRTVVECNALRGDCMGGPREASMSRNRSGGALYTGDPVSQISQLFKWRYRAT